MNDTPTQTGAWKTRPENERGRRTSELIINTASKLFAAKGFAATSVDEIAASCRVGKDTIYRRFPSKLALFVAVIEYARERTLERLHMVLAVEGDALARLKHVARWFLATNLDPELVAFKRIAYSEASVVEIEEDERTATDPIMTPFVELVRKAQQDGALRAGDTAFIARQLIHCIVAGPVGEALLGMRTYDSSEAQDEHFEKAWELFLEGARP